MINIGKYRAKAIKPSDIRDAMGKASTGTKFIKLGFQVTEGPDAGETVPWSGYFTANTTERTLQSLKYCGARMKDDDVTDLEGVDRNEVEIVVEHEQYTNKQGEEKTHARVAWVNSLAAGVSDAAKMGDADLAAFKRELAGAVRLANQKGGPGAAPPAGGGAMPDF